MKCVGKLNVKKLVHFLQRLVKPIKLWKIYFKVLINKMNRAHPKTGYKIHLRDS